MQIEDQNLYPYKTAFCKKCHAEIEYMERFEPPALCEDCEQTLSLEEQADYIFEDGVEPWEC